MEEVTNNLIGETETLVGTGLCGVIYGLFAVQPLSILAFTGPLLLYEEVIIEVGGLFSNYQYEIISFSSSLHTCYTLNIYHGGHGLDCG